MDNKSFIMFNYYDMEVGEYMSSEIRVIGATQNNLKNINVSFKTGELTVITGVSGSGKSSLAFDTLYAEGQRKYVETFSAYSRQFLDRMDKPAVQKIEGILPAIAINQTNPVKQSRSSVGTMTELNDYLKLLFARQARLYCQGCAKEVIEDCPTYILDVLRTDSSLFDLRCVVTFPVHVPATWGEERAIAYLSQQGYTRVHYHRRLVLVVVILFCIF